MHGENKQNYVQDREEYKTYERWSKKSPTIQ